MNNGIIRTALTGLPLELEYRPCPALNQDRPTLPEPPSQPPERTLSGEFECLLSVL